MDYLWHKVEKEDQEKIRKEAKAILDKFSDALEKAGEETKDFRGVQRDIQLRDEKKTETDKNFRKRFFSNAPAKDGDFILAEKGAWK